MGVVKFYYLIFLIFLWSGCNDGGIRKEKEGEIPSRSVESPPIIDIGVLDPRPAEIPIPSMTIPWRRMEGSNDPISDKPQRTILKSMLDRFTKEKEKEKADILWVIDNSCSMIEERDKAAKNLDAFISDFNVSGLDYQMAVISTHTHDALFYGKPPVLKYDDPLLKERFSERIRMEEVCTWDAHGLYAAHLALSEPRRSRYNKGFLRDDAFLIIIVISDADEDYELTSPEYYKFFTSLKPGKPYKVNISAIVGDRPGGCRSESGDAEPGLQYLDLADMTRGFFESICSPDYSEALNRIGKNLNSYINAYPLSEAPDQKYPIIVKVDGRVIERHPTRGWTYNSTLNMIQFTGNFKPQIGDVIEITYMSHEN
jgi:hypothetical protein